MKVIVVAAQKGGTGKTTLSGHLGVELANRGFKTVLVDTDPQGSLKAWWESREAAQPALMSATAKELAAALPALRKDGFQYMIVDTPPQVTQLIKDIVNLADLVLIPAKPSSHDLRAVGKTVELVADSKKIMVFVLNEVRPRTRLEGQAVAAMSQHGKVSPIVYDRQDFVSSMTDGRVAQELRPSGKAAREIEALCTYLLQQLAETPPKKRGKPL